MKIKLPALLALCMFLRASPAYALQVDELIAVTAMPLAVADVVALPDVSRTEVMTVVTTLNEAAVPAPQFVEIVRYVPVALVQTAEPRFVTYVTQEYERGVVGQPLATSIATRYSAYGIQDFDVVHPPVLTVVEQRMILPQVVVTRFRPVDFDPLALIAMPLAVAAVADIADVPRTDFMRFIASLNQARVPAPQFVEVVRYSPMVFVDRTAVPEFIQFVTTEVDRGVVGRPLAFSIASRIETFEPMHIDVIAPRQRWIADRGEIFPPVVITRVARAHPHGGPPGQLKKELGLQTGAEVVHGTAPNRVARNRSVDVDRNDGRKPQRVTADIPKVSKAHGKRSRSGDSGIRQERRKSAPAVQPQVEQRRPEKVRPATRSRGDAVSTPGKQRGNRGAEQRGNSGGGKGKGKGKG